MLFTYSGKPIGLRWRASSWTITFVVTLGIAVDLLVASVIIPVMPFQLQRLGYSNISMLTGWLLFSFSAGLVVSTIPIALFFERYALRRWPFIIGVIILIASQVMFMEAPNYPTMCIARLIQGVGSSMVWVIGLALLSDSAPKSLIGCKIPHKVTHYTDSKKANVAQLGIAMSGVSFGTTIGPPVGGALYSRFGFRAPFVFSIAATVLDLIGRLVIIERKDSMKWGYDPTVATSHSTSEPECLPGVVETENVQVAADIPLQLEADEKTSPTIRTFEKRLSFLSVVSKLLKSSRALTALFITFTYGLIFSAQEPVIPLHLQKVWGLDSKGVGIAWIASVVPTFFSSVLAGFWLDKSGTEWPTIACLLLSLPWWIIITVEYRLSLFIATFALAAFFTSGVVSPITADLATFSRNLEGVGFGHVYGAFNLAYGIGSTVGPILAGQMYAHIVKGWMAICFVFVGLLVLCFMLSMRFIGDDPLYLRLYQCN